MKCPKCKELLAPSKLFVSLDSAGCNSCQGQWVDGDQYQVWRQTQPRLPIDPASVLLADLSDYQVPSLFDGKAGLCPQCLKILSRTRVSTKPFFYLDHCLSCNGIWFDRDEPAVLEKLQLQSQIEILCSALWQNQVRTAQLLISEKQAIVDKLGIEIAQQVFDLADTLKNLPDGDFALAYMIRRFERDPVSMPQ